LVAGDATIHNEIKSFADQFPIYYYILGNEKISHSGEKVFGDCFPGLLSLFSHALLREAVDGKTPPTSVANMFQMTTGDTGG
jgi:hypothetical protein